MATFKIPSSQMETIRRDYPSVKSSTIQTKYTKYKQLVIEQMVINVLWRNKFIKGQLNESEISKELGHFGSGKIRAKAVFDKHCNLYEAPKYGSTGKGTGRGTITKHVTFNIPMNEVYDYIMTTNISALLKDLTKNLKLAESTPEYHVSIDMESLAAYISRTKDYVETLTDKNAIKATHEMLVYAGAILQVAYENNEMLPQYAEVKNTGRIYYKGLNLQNCPKVVRYAALGNCTQFDFRANSYAILLELAITICVNNGVATREALLKEWSMVSTYIEDRKAVRNNIAEAVFGVADDYAISKVKTAFTMFGFGAKAVNNPHTAIGKALGNKEHTKKFLDHYIFKDLFTQFSEICNIVYIECEQNEVFDKVVANEYEKCGGNGLMEHNLGKVLDRHYKYGEDRPLRGKPFYGRVLAHAYQAQEALLMRAFVEMLNHDGEILWLHDGIVVRGYRSKTWVDAITQIKTLYPSVSVDRDEFDHWVDTRERDAESEIEILAHMRLIGEQERIAVDYVPVNANIKPNEIQSKDDVAFNAYCDLHQIPKEDRERVRIAQGKASKKPANILEELTANSTRH